MVCLSQVAIARACVGCMVIASDATPQKQKTRERSISRGFSGLHGIAWKRSWCRGPDLNRQANQGGGFSSHCFFRSRRRERDAVRALDYAFAVARGRDRCPCALGAPRLVSTPSSREPRGLARRCLDARIRGFAEFEGFCTDRFRPGTQSFKSAMFTNFITPARGRTRFYHCLRMRSLIRATCVGTRRTCALHRHSTHHRIARLHPV